MRRRVAVLLLVVVAASGCAPDAAETTFTVTLEAGDQVAPLPVTLVDRTGLVTSIEAVHWEAIDFREGTVMNDVDRPDALVVTWLGGMCDIEVDLLFEGGGSAYRLTEHTEAGQGGCRLAGIGRAVAITLRQPVPAEIVTFERAE